MVPLYHCCPNFFLIWVPFGYSLVDWLLVIDLVVGPLSLGFDCNVRLGVLVVLVVPSPLQMSSPLGLVAPLEIGIPSSS